MVGTKTTLFLTGAHGWIGQAVRRAGQDRTDLEVCIVDRKATANDWHAAFCGHEGQAVLLHLAWPSLQLAAATATKDESLGRLLSDEQHWRDFLHWSTSLCTTAAQYGVRVVGVGSGIETYVDQQGESLGTAYLNYALQKRELKAQMIAAARSTFSWLRLHFLFGMGERPSRFVPAAIVACGSGTTLSCGDLSRRRNWLAVDQAAALLCDFVQCAEDGEWDIAAHQDLSFAELLSLIEQAVGERAVVASTMAPTSDATLALIHPQQLWPKIPEFLGNSASLLPHLRGYAQRLLQRNPSPGMT